MSVLLGLVASIPPQTCLLGMLLLTAGCWLASSLDDRRTWGGFRLGDPLPGGEHDPDLEAHYPLPQRRAWGDDDLDEPEGGDAA